MSDRTFDRLDVPTHIEDARKDQVVESMDLRTIRDDSVSTRVRATQSTGDVSTQIQDYNDSPFDISDTEITQIRNRYTRGTQKPLEEKHQRLNTMFGIKPFQPAVTNRPLEEHSETVKGLYAEPSEYKSASSKSKSCFNLSNYVWVVICGWWMFLVYGITGVLLILTYFGRKHGFLCLSLATYYFYPFGKFILIERDETTISLIQGEQEQSTMDNSDAPGAPSYHSVNDMNNTTHKKKKKRNCGIGCIIWSLFAWSFLFVANCISFLICWMLVFFVPMAKVMRVGIIEILFSPSPLGVRVSKGYPNPKEDVLLCVFQAANRFYYKYSTFGVNIVLFNLFPFVLLALTFAYLPYLVPALKLPDTLMFIICLFSVIPLAYYTGLALSSLSAQTSFAVGAVLNSTFGSLIELILYCSAILNGSLDNLVQSSVTGTLLGMMLLLPGLSMLFGGIKYKEVRFNPASAGVSGVLLLLSVIGSFTPTVYYSIYGNYVLDCSECETFTNNGTFSCTQCTWTEGDIDNDDIYNDYARPLQFVCAGILPISYFVGLLFTLKTHAYIVDDPEYIDLEAAAAHGPSGPKWSRVKCLVILISCTVLFALISEEMVNTLTPTIQALGISETFAGLTIIALIPNTAEFVNAIQFSLHNNFSMSLEIANSASVQIALLQMPILVFFSALASPHNASAGFTLFFPMLDLFAVMFSVIIMNYVSIDGRANYFTGVALIISYLVFVASFFYIPS